MLFNKTTIIPISDFFQQVQYNTATPIFDFSLTQQISQLNEHLKSIGKVLYYITHPKQLLIILWHCTLEYNYLICLLICVAGVIMYILGHKKGTKWISGSIIVYTLMQAINSAL